MPRGKANTDEDKDKDLEGEEGKDNDEGGEGAEGGDEASENKPKKGKKLVQSEDGAYKVLNSLGDIIGSFEDKKDAETFASQKSGRKVVKQ